MPDRGDFGTNTACMGHMWIDNMVLPTAANTPHADTSSGASHAKRQHCMRLITIAIERTSL